MRYIIARPAPRLSSLLALTTLVHITHGSKNNFKPRYGAQLEKNKHFFIGDPSTSLGQPGQDPIDLEWDEDWVGTLSTATPGGGTDLLQKTIIEEGSTLVTTHQLPQVATGTNKRMINFNQEELALGGEPRSVALVLRSGGYPMCPNYWDIAWGVLDEDENAEAGAMPDHLGRKNGNPVSYYKYPTGAVGSPFKGDPELSFCRRVQVQREASCCVKMLDDDIQEEFEELTGGGYLRAHVFLQQFMCLPCHPMVSCMIDEKNAILNIPLTFAQRLAERMEDFDKTGLKIKTGEFNADSGPLRQDELALPIQWFGTDNSCVCTSTKNCECVRSFLYNTRPPSINDYDGTPLNISIIEGDPCGVLEDLLPGSKSESGAIRTSWSMATMMVAWAAAMISVCWQ